MHLNRVSKIIIITDEEGDAEVKLYVQGHSCIM